MTENAFLSIFAGLGLFFIGIKGIGANLTQLAGRRLRLWIERSTEHYLLRALVGAAAGALTQSTNAVTVVLISLGNADLMTMRKARPILAWANVGTSALVLLTAVNIHFLVFAMLGVIGCCYYANLDRSPRWRPLVSALLSLGLLFLGTELMHAGSQQLRDLAWIQELMISSRHSLAVSFLVALALALLVQSAAVVTVVAMTMTEAGLLSLPNTTLVVYGASLGVALGAYLLSLSSRGTLRQLAIFQVLVKLMGAAVMIPLFILEDQFNLPLVLHAARALSRDPARQTALIYLAFQLVSVLSRLATAPFLQRLLDALSPPTPLEHLSRPHFLYEQAIGEPETALMLAQQEQSRIFAMLPLHIGIDDQADAREKRLSRGAVMDVAAALVAATKRFLQDLADTGASRDVLDRIADLQGQNALLQSLHESMHELAEALRRSAEAPGIARLAGNLREGLGALLLTAGDAMRSLDPEELDTLRQITGDRDSVVDTLRRRALAVERGLADGDQQLLYAITSLFERIVWMLRRAANQAAESRASALAREG